MTASVEQRSLYLPVNHCGGRTSHLDLHGRLLHAKYEPPLTAADLVYLNRDEWTCERCEEGFDEECSNPRCANYVEPVAEPTPSR